jgi:hypothetical protein
MEPVPRRQTEGAMMLRCGCTVYPADLHDVDDCLEAQADELAYLEDLHHSGQWER